MNDEAEMNKIARFNQRADDYYKTRSQAIERKVGYFARYLKAKRKAPADWSPDLSTRESSIRGMSGVKTAGRSVKVSVQFPPELYSDIQRALQTVAVNAAQEIADLAGDVMNEAFDKAPRNPPHSKGTSGALRAMLGLEVQPTLTGLSISLISGAPYSRYVHRGGFVSEHIDKPARQGMAGIARANLLRGAP